MTTITDSNSTNTIIMGSGTTAAPFADYSINEESHNTWDYVGGIGYTGDGTVKITLHADSGPVGSITDTITHFGSLLNTTNSRFDPASNTYTFTEQAHEGAYAGAPTPDDILQHLVYRAPDTATGTDVFATVSYTGNVATDNPYPTPNILTTQTFTAAVPFDIQVKTPAQLAAPDGAISAPGYHYENGVPVADAQPAPAPTPDPAPATPAPSSTAPTITDTGSNPVTVASGGTASPFAQYSINDTVHQTWDTLYGGSGTVKVTLHASSGPVGTISDSFTSVYGKGTGAYDAATNTYTFTEDAHQSATAPVLKPDNILDELVYHAPDTATGADVYATVSYTGEAGTNNPYPTPNTVTTQTITDPDQLDLSIQPAPQPAPAPAPAPQQPATPVATQQPTPAPYFAVMDGTTGQGSTMAGDAYNGPVGGLQHQLIMLISDNLAVSAAVPNSFIHTGSGNDAIDVSAVSGNNVLDGGTGSNFLVGGAGSDTFFLDARNAPASTWSTVGNFHSGDAATLWGLTPQDFALSWVDGQGASGHQGLTLHATGNAGQPEASLTLAGYSTADLSNGRLAMVFGHNDGGNYLYVHAA